eukprot:COSAG01_NODE_1918_length_8905_cov_2.532591_7_plen_455_part_00
MADSDRDIETSSDNPLASSKPTGVAMHPAADSEGDATHDEPTVEWPYPPVFSVVRKGFLFSMASTYFLQAFVIVAGIGWPLSRHLGVHGAETNNALEWTTDVCYCCQICLWSSAAPYMRQALISGGGLEKLGILPDAPVLVNSADRPALRRWKWGLTFVSFLFVLLGLGGLYTLTNVGKTSKFTGRMVTPLYAALVGVPAVPTLGLFCALVFVSWIYALQLASRSVSLKIENVCKVTSRLHPDDGEWQSEVVIAINLLARVTLPDLSNAFGNALGFNTLGWWMGSLGHFAGFLYSRSLLQFLQMILTTFMPFALAASVVNTSDNCDKLRDIINKQRGDELETGINEKTELQLVALERYIQNLNSGQGLGFVVFGVVIDIGMINKIFTALVSFLITVVPIVLTLHDSAYESGTNDMGTASECRLTSDQTDLVHKIFTSFNTTCAWNVTANNIPLF